MKIPNILLYNFDIYVPMLQLIQISIEKFSTQVIYIRLAPLAPWTVAIFITHRNGNVVTPVPFHVMVLDCVAAVAVTIA